jgi:hypothetical protein
MTASKGSRHSIRIGIGAAVASTLGCLVTIDRSLIGQPPASPSTEAGSAMADGGPSGDRPDGGDAGRWCAVQSPAPIICSDFDSEVAFGGGWEGPNETLGGVIRVDSTSFTSAPSSLVATTPPLAGDAGGSEPARARLCRRIARFPSEAHLAFDVRIDEVGPTASTAVGSIRVLSPNDAETLYLDVRVDGARGWQFSHETQSAPTPIAAGLAPVVPGRWTRVRMDVTVPPPVIAGGTVTSFVSIHLDGQLATSRGVPSPVSGGLTEACVGIIAVVAPSGPWAVRADNVTFDMVPPP